MIKYIWVTFQKQGFHCYPDAAVRPDLKPVDFLQYRHRHVFHFRIDIQVFEDDREIEFIMFNDFCQSLVQQELDNKSCEMIAQNLYEKISQKYPNRKLKISVSEDNENGAILEI